MSPESLRSQDNVALQIAQGHRCNIITYGSLIQAAERRGKWCLALWFSDKMNKDNILPNTMTFNALLSACAQGASLYVHRIMVFSGKVSSILHLILPTRREHRQC